MYELQIEKRSSKQEIAGSAQTVIEYEIPRNRNKLIEMYFAYFF